MPILLGALGSKLIDTTVFMEVKAYYLIIVPELTQAGPQVPLGDVRLRLSAWLWTPLWLRQGRLLTLKVWPHLFSAGCPGVKSFSSPALPTSHQSLPSGIAVSCCLLPNAQTQMPRGLFSLCWLRWGFCVCFFKARELIWCQLLPHGPKQKLAHGLS